MKAQEIENRIKNQLPDCDVAVIDSTGDANHFDVRIASAAFLGKTRIQQHKMIFNLFQNELMSGELHALQLKTLIKA